MINIPQFCFSILSGSHNNIFGCNLQPITLQCPANQTINVTSALFGQFLYPCSLSCCAPHPTDDCTADLPAVDFQYLKFLCDGQETCSFENPGSALPGCADPYISDYMSVYYTCVPGTSTLHPPPSLLLAHPILFALNKLVASATFF